MTKTNEIVSGYSCITFYIIKVNGTNFAIFNDGPISYYQKLKDTKWNKMINPFYEGSKIYQIFVEDTL